VDPSADSFATAAYSRDGRGVSAQRAADALRREQIGELRRKFAEDKRKIEELKAQRSNGHQPHSTFEI
jgi:hypothetical protein